MNSSKKLLLSVLVSIVATVGVGAKASSNNDYPEAPKTKSTTSRAAVKAEAVSAKKAGTVIKNDVSYPSNQMSIGPGKTRAQVQAEVKEAKVKGRIADNEYPSK